MSKMLLRMAQNMAVRSDEEKSVEISAAKNTIVRASKQ